MLKRLTTRVGERGLDAALTAHRGSALPVRHATAEQHARPGKGQQTVPTATGPWDLVVPRARHGRFLPPLVPKRPRRLEGGDAQRRRLDARGLSTRERQGHREARDGTAGSPTLLSPSTAAVREDVRPW